MNLFVTRVVNALETLVVVVNIITVVLEGVSAMLFEETKKPEWVSLVESILQIFVLVGEWENAKGVNVVVYRIPNDRTSLFRNITPPSIEMLKTARRRHV